MTGQKYRHYYQLLDKLALMNDCFLDKCYFVNFYDHDFIYRQFKKILYRDDITEKVASKCFGFALPGFNKKESGYLISKKHPCLLPNIKSTKKLQLKFGIRKKYANHLRSTINYDVIPFFPDNNSFISNAVAYSGSKIKLLRTEGNKVLIPHILSYKDWLDITKELQPAEYSKASFPKRQTMIFNTIRHSIGVYDEATKNTSDETYGHICWEFSRMVRDKFPELDTAARNWLEFKTGCGVDLDCHEIDYFDLDKFTVVPFSKDS